MVLPWFLRSPIDPIVNDVAAAKPYTQELEEVVIDVGLVAFL